MRQARLLEAYENNIRQLSREFNIVIVNPIPEAGWDVPNQISKRILFNVGDENLDTSYIVYKERSKEVINLFNILEKEIPNVYVARVERALCNEKTERCLNADRYGIYYYDDDHLSNAGARLVAPVITDAIKAANAGTR